MKQSAEVLGDQQQQEQASIGQIPAKKKRTTKSSDQMQKIVVTVGNRTGIADIRKSFVGRWLIEPDERFQDEGSEWAVALTKKKALAVYITDPTGSTPPMFYVLDSLEDLEGVVPEEVIAEVASELGVPYEIEMEI